MKISRRWAITAAAAAIACSPVLSTSAVASSEASGGASATAQAASLRVMTWNINSEKVQNFWGWVNVIANQKPDVVSLQEACTNDAPVLARWLKGRGLDYHVEIRPTNIHWACGFGSQGQVILSKQKPRSVVKRDYRTSDSQRRGYLAETIDMGPRPVRIVNTHAYNNTGGWEKPTDNVNQLAGWAASGAETAQIIMGDLNATPRQVTPLYRAGLKDADPTHRTTKGTVKLDYILYRGAPALQGPAQVIKSPSSDHSMVITNFQIS
ncbi:endonuclease/exonuclease/phosphatase family protein [Streptomyces malaysiensis]|uniref:endonuclease/exonuclease/phosphatase family protein n=1 Tax=Streptomyces malaysiensis TaxID=92644 RepID=UPI002B29E98F|nr:endonuclease/exonuclease/phosphatase family protein [Streptomyces malaysiensis]